MPLLWVLRDVLGMTGIKFGCCTVLSAARRCGPASPRSAGLHHAAGWPLSSLAQQPHKVPRIAFLTTASPPGSQCTHAFIRGLADLGRVEGHNIAIDCVASGTVPPVRGRSRGFERGCHRGREQSSVLGRQEREQDNSYCHCDDGGPGATRIRPSLAHPGGSTRGSTSKRWLAAHRPAFRIKLPVT